MIILDVRKELGMGKNICELPLRVCYYARVSTDHELQATSIINQVDYFRKYVLGCSNWRLVNGYVDEGISGKDVKKRENFMKMIKDGEDHKFDLVLTKSVSRFARNTIDSIYYTNYLLDLGVGVIFINDNINTFYSDSEFRLTLMASIAQDELRKLSESVKFGLRQSIKRGVVLGNSNILGYRKNKGKLVVVEEEAVIVREMFLLFLEGDYYYTEIARKMNKKYNKMFDSSSIRRILTNYKYKGYYCGGKSEVIDYKKNRRNNLSKEEWITYLDYDKVPPIVEETIWDKVQEKIEKRSSREMSGYENKIFCMRHQRLFVHKRKKYKDRIYHYFVCPNCCSMSSALFDRINKYHDIEKIFIYSGEEYKLVVKC